MSPKFQITNAITDCLSQIDQAKGFLEATQLSKEWIERIAHQALIREAHHTTHIEGTQLSLEQTERLISGEQLVDVDPDDEQEVRNYLDAFDFIKQYVVGSVPISGRMILEIHRRLVSGVRGDNASPGEYRKKQNYVVHSETREVIYTPPPPESVQDLMNQFFDWLNTPSTIHPVLISGIAQFQIVHIHPFRDGNGRTSRLLSTLCLYRSGYDFKRLFTISEYYDRNRESFYNAIQGVRDQNMDMTGWLEYFTHGLTTQLTELKTRSEQMIQTDLLANKLKLSTRQKELVIFIASKNELTLAELVQAYPNIPRRTLQRDLKHLVDMNVVRTTGATRSAHYSLVVNDL